MTQKIGSLGVSNVKRNQSGEIVDAELNYVSMDDGPEVMCPYCEGEAEWVENKAVYGRNYGRSYMMWLCKPCDAYVGCHNNTKKPLGTLANKETRKERKETHAVLDPFWLNAKDRRGTRTNLYRILSDHFGREVHIGAANVQQCKEIRQFLQENEQSLFITLT